jgi:glycosyltransferase involved in cell wall biosynthesis
MKRLIKVFIWADVGWSIGKIHLDLKRYLSDEFEFILYNWDISNDEVALNIDYETCDVFMSCYQGLYYYKKYFPNLNLKKALFIAHGYPEMQAEPFPSPLATYGMTSNSIRYLFPSYIKPFYTPNCVDLTDYKHRSRIGLIRNIGWAGNPLILCKQYHWAVEIANRVALPLILTSSSNSAVVDNWRPIPREAMPNWYDSIDMLLITSIPEESVETGPLPAFEAIASGAIVIGTPVGNFNQIPGPKFLNVDLAVQTVLQLINDPGLCEHLAAEQFSCVSSRWNYQAVSHKWRAALRTAAYNAGGCY